MFKSGPGILGKEQLRELKLFGFWMVILFLAVSCSSGKIPCPKIGGKSKFPMFHKKADPTKPNEEGFGQSKRMAYNKNGLIKKKSYKSLKNKPKH